MKIIVCSKNDFPRKVDWTRSTGEKWAYISIECTDDLVTNHIVKDNDHYLPDGPDVLNIEFDDVAEDREFTRVGRSDKYCARVITEEQGMLIWEFAQEHRDCNLLVHCKAGQSRSQGVFRALMDSCPEYWQECDLNQENPCLTPNVAVVAAIIRNKWINIFN